MNEIDWSKVSGSLARIVQDYDIGVYDQDLKKESAKIVSHILHQLCKAIDAGVGDDWDKTTEVSDEHN